VSKSDIPLLLHHSYAADFIADELFFLAYMQYSIISRLGSGGFGNVYQVEGSDGNTYAMKLLKSADVINKKRFEREIKILATLDHPNVVRIYEWNLGGDPPDFSPWYVMEYLRGGTLREHMDAKFRNRYVFQRNRSISSIILPICNALAQAHSMSIYHRDLKPDNIVYVDGDRSSIKITDWGLGRDINRKSLMLTAELGHVGGDPGYCAPEQWFFSENVVDGRADIFSMGVIWYELMTGRRPAHYDNRMARPAIEPPSKFHPSISPQTERLILKMLSLYREERPQSVWELMAEIESLPDARYY
jgi:serine/threonine protein kinase